MKSAEGFLKEIGVENIPKLSIIVCTTPRSGSTALSSALRQTGLLGNPKEYFLFWYWQRYEPRRFEKDALRAWILPNDLYLKRVFEKGTTENGVFSTKMMWEQFEEMLIKLRTFPQFKNADAQTILNSVFPNLHYVSWLRRDKIRQAVSHAKALQSGRFHSQQKRFFHYDENKYTTEVKENLNYDFYQIFFLYQSLLRKEKAWEAYFAKAGIQPHRLEYETFQHGIEAAAGNIAENVNVLLSIQENSEKIDLKKLRNTVNDEWTQRFQEEFAAKTRTPFHKLWLYGSQACISRYHKYFKL